MFKCRSLRMNAKRRLYEELVVSTALYGAEAKNIEAAEKRKLNVMEMWCLGSMCVYSIHSNRASGAVFTKVLSYF